MRRLSLTLAAAGVVLAVVLLVGTAWDAIQREQETRSAMVAERVFDELERALAAWIAEEEERPFLHWNHVFVVDNDLGMAAPRTSPLATLEAPGLVGYYQRAPDGRLRTPYRRADGSPTRPDASAIEATLRQALARELPGSRGPVSPPEPRTPEPTVLQLLNKGLQQRDPQATVQSANLSQLGNFVRPEAPTIVDPTRRDIDVGPLHVENSDPWLVTSRILTLEGQRWEQGIVVERAPFLQALSTEAIGDLPGLALRWDGTFDRVHRFQPPFDGLVASLQLEPPSATRASRVLVATTLLLVLALTTGTWLVTRWVAASDRMARQRTDFVAAVTHELRTPLTAIQMYAEMLETGSAPPESRTDYLATIRSEALRLGALVENVLTFSALERAELAPSPLAPIDQVLDDVFRALAPIAAERGVTLTSTRTGELPSAPRQTMQRILHNLVENAIKFSEQPGRIEVRLTPEGIEVENPAKPLTSDLLARMFDPFVRGESELTRRTRGTGIGLAVVQRLVGSLGGRIQARNSDVGVVVAVTLPQVMLDNA